MRIITGKARGTTLKTLDGDATRPTSEKVKEAVFSMIQFDIEGRRVLDLFGGSGQMALEALSRDARLAVIVDESRDAVAVIKENAQKTHLFPDCRIVQTGYREYLRGVRGDERFDIVFLDPPYASYDYLTDALKTLVEKNLLAENALIVCETDRKEPVEAEGLRLLRHNKYGRVFISLLTNCPAEEK